MKIKWLGHASFLVESKEGTKILTDPFEAGSYDGAVGYSPIHDEADIVTVSHDHADHNAVDTVGGSPEVVRGAERRTVKGIEIRGVNTYGVLTSSPGSGKNYHYYYHRYCWWS